MRAPSPLTPPVVAALTWGNKGNATAVANSGGAIWMSGQGSLENIRHLYKAAPARPYSLVVGFILAPGIGAPNRAGLAVRTSTGLNAGHISFLFADSETAPVSQRLSLGNWNPYTAFSGYSLDLAYPWIPPIMWMKFNDDGANLNWYISVDGQNWVTFHSVTYAASFTGSPDQVGIAIDPGDPNRANGGLFLHWAGI